MSLKPKPTSATVGAGIRRARVILSKVSDTAVLDAERLLLAVLGHDETSSLYAYKHQELSEEQQQEFESLVQKRATGKPLAYILGEWEFYGRPFYVTPDVLVPRPSTEDLIEAALPYIDAWRGRHPGEQMTIADIGTGSGIIAITLALETQAKIIATDISPAALNVAKKNAQRHGVAERIEFLQGDLTAPLADRKIDLLVTNPPYVPSLELDQSPTVETRALTFEPRLALDGGPDGKVFIQRIAVSGIPAWVETRNGTVCQFNF